MYSRMEKYHGRRAQRFSIRKYSFGAASVLLGTALLLGANAVKADETLPVNPTASDLAATNKKDADSALTTPVVEELPELKIDAVKADEKAKAKEDAKTEATPVVEKEITEATAEKTDKKLETDVKEKSDKEQADKKEATKEKTDKGTSEKATTEKAQDDVKTVLTQLTSEADVMASVASNFSDKEVKDDASKQKLSAAVAAVKLEAVASKGLLTSDASKDQMVAQVNRLSAAIEAVYAEMKRAGHAGSVEAVLADSNTQPQTVTGNGVIRAGKAVVNVQNAYVSMNNTNTAPTAWGLDVVFDTSRVEKGDTTTIELHNLADLGAAFKTGTEITAPDGTVIGKVKSIASSNSTGNKGTTSPYWAQRMKDGMTYEQRVAEQPPIANETGTVTYTIEWNEKAKNYAVTTYSAANLTGSGYIAPAISKDTPYTATIKVDGQTVLEHTYTHLATKPDTNKYGTSANLVTDNGIGYKGAERVSKNDAVVLQSDDDISYGKGSTFTIKLPSDEFTYFRELNGGTKTVTDANGTYRPANRWTNVRANENNVWILQDGRDSHFSLKATIKSPTELVLEVVDGQIEPGSIVSMNLANLGVEKVLTDRTLTDEFSKIIYNELGHVQNGSTIGNDKTAATLTVTGGTSVNGQPEDVTTKVPNGWVVKSSTAASNTVETGAVTLTLTDLETGKVIGYVPTEYNGKAEIQDNGTYNTKNVLGKKYDVTSQVPELIKHIQDTDYVLVNIPPKGPAGTINVSEKRVRDIMTADEISTAGLNPNAYVNNVIYSYIKKTKDKDITRKIKYVYADNVTNLAGQEVFPERTDKASYTGTVKLTTDGKAEVDANNKPIYVNWRANGDTTLPEVAVPQKEGFVASLELVPAKATTAETEDYEVVVKYTAIQKAQTTFEDEKGNSIPGVEAITEQGGSEAPLTKEAEVKAKIKELENKGYELVSNTYPENGNFDNDTSVNQEFKVVLKQKEVTVTPNNPKTPGTPVDPNNPDGPKYPAGLEEKDLNKTVTRTITYVYADGSPVLNEDGTPKTVTQEAKFTREAKVNLVTGDVTYGDWSEAKDLPEVKSPVVPGFLADKASVPVVNVTGDSKDITEVVTYKPLGSWIPNIPGETPTPIKYPNNPDDPTKPGKPTETLPYLPGYTPEDKDGNPLKPVDPQDPSKGYVVPNVPTDPSEDTVINYKANKANLVVKYVDEKGKDLIPAETTEGKVGDEYSTSGKVIPGYLLVRVDGEAKGKIGKDGSTVTYVYKPIGSWIPNIPGQPTNPIKYPNDPQDPTKPGKPTETLPYVPGYTPQDGNGQPLKPVDPQDPTKGYVVPNIPTDPSQDTVINYKANDANLVVKYVDEKGKDLIPAETTKGKVGDEYTTTGKVIKGYVLARVEGEAKGKIGKDGSTVTYVYKPIGSWIPNIPGQPTSSIKYPNDPQDPTKPGKPTETLPYVPGYTPQDGNGQPLKPVDPQDPTKGYVVPNIPTDPSQDTVINYVATEANLVVKYVDEKGKDLIPAETTKVKIGDEYTTTGKVIKGYVLVRVEGEAKGKIGKEGSTVTYVYQPLGSWVPNIPGQPTSPIKYPNDPTDPTKPGKPTETLPYVPGYTPVDGNGNPLKPVDPQDPTKGYIVPDIPTNPGQDTVINYVANPKPQPNQDQKPQPKPAVTPEKSGQNSTPDQSKANGQVKRLANTGTTETNTGLAGLGLAALAGLLTAARRRKEK